MLHTTSHNSPPSTWLPYTCDSPPASTQSHSPGGASKYAHAFHGPRPPRSTYSSLHASKCSFANISSITSKTTIPRQASLTTLPTHTFSQALPTSHALASAQSIHSSSQSQKQHLHSVIAVEDANAASPLATRQIRQQCPMTDVVGYAPTDPFLKTALSTSQVAVITEPMPESPPELATSPLSPLTSPLLATPRHSLHIRDSIAFNAPLFSTPWRSTTLFTHAHTRGGTSSSTNSTTSSSYSSDVARSPALLPIGKKMGVDSARELRTMGGMGRGKGTGIRSGSYQCSTDVGLSSAAWQRPQLSRIDTQTRIHHPPPHILHPVHSMSLAQTSSPCLESHLNAGLGLNGGNLFTDGHHRHPSLPAPSLIPFSPSSTNSDGDTCPLSATLSAETTSPSGDNTLTVRDKRARRQGVDFHSHAQFVEVFNLSDAEVEPDFMFDLPMRNGSQDGNIEKNTKCEDDVPQRDTVSGMVDGMMSDDLDDVLNGWLEEDIEPEDFSWEAEEPGDEEQLDHSEFDRTTGLNQNGILMGVEEQGRYPSPSLLSPISPITGVNLPSAVKFGFGPEQVARMRDGSMTTDLYDSMEEEPIPHSPAGHELLTLTLDFGIGSDIGFDEPRSAFSDSDSDCGSNEEIHNYRASLHSHSHRSTGTLSKKFKALKASMSVSSLKAKSKGSISHSHSSSISSMSAASFSTTSSSRHHLPSPLSSPMTTLSSLSPASATLPLSQVASPSQWHSSPHASSLRTPISLPAPSPPPCIPLPPIPSSALASVPPHLAHPNSLPFVSSSEADVPDFNPYLVETVDVDGSKYRMTAVDPDTSMVKLEMSMTKLRAHRPQYQLSTKRHEMEQMKEEKTETEMTVEQVIVSEKRLSIPSRTSLILPSETPSEKEKEDIPVDNTGIKDTPRSHICEWRFPDHSDDGHKPSEAGHTRKPPFSLLPLFDFEQPMSPSERRSSKQIRLSRQLRRTSSLLELDDLRNALRLSTASSSSAQSSTLVDSREGLSNDSHPSAEAIQHIPPYKPPIDRSLKKTPPKKIVPFLHRSVRNECISDISPHLPAAIIQIRNPPEPTPRIRRPSVNLPMMKTPLRMRALSRASEIPTSFNPKSDSEQSHGERASRTRRFWGRVSVQSDKKVRSVSVFEKEQQ